MMILHFSAGLGIEVDPDDLSPIRNPGAFATRRHQNFSAPTRPSASTSPPCLSGSNALSFWAKLSFGLPADRTRTPPSTTSTVMGKPRAKRAALAIGDVIRIPRPLPHSCTVCATLTLDFIIVFLNVLHKYNISRIVYVSTCLYGACRNVPTLIPPPHSNRRHIVLRQI